MRATHPEFAANMIKIENIIKSFLSSLNAFIESNILTETSVAVRLSANQEKINVKNQSKNKSFTFVIFP